jgi:hypothetical protein
MQFLIINLAAPEENELVNNTRDAKIKKLSLKGTASSAVSPSGSDVVIESLYGLVRRHLDGKLDDSDYALTKLKQQCTSAGKVLIATHGSLSKPDCCLIDLPTGEPDKTKREELMSAKDLGEFVLRFLPEEKTNRIVLVMCWGARGVEGNQHINFNQPVGDHLLKSSFAFKFFISICTKRIVTMSAWTGMMNFNKDTGHSVIEDESSLEARRNQLNLVKDQERQRCKEAYDRLESKPALDNVLTAAWRAFKSKNSTPMDAVLATTAKNAAEAIVLAEYRWRHAIEQQRKRVTECVTEKSGKFMYSYENGKVRIRRRYPRLSETQLGDTVEPEFLYDGPIV